MDFLYKILFLDISCGGLFPLSLAKACLINMHSLVFKTLIDILNNKQYFEETRGGSLKKKTAVR